MFEPGSSAGPGCVVHSSVGAKDLMDYVRNVKGGRFNFSSAGIGTAEHLTGEYLLEPVGEKTKVTYRMSMDLGVPLPGFLKRQGEKKIVDVALKGLKRRVESKLERHVL